MIKILFHPLAPFIVTILVIGLWVSFFMTAREIRQSGQLVSSLQHQVTQQQQEVNDLQTKLQNAQNPYTQEAVIRNELLLQKPGEYVVQMPELPATTHPPVSNSSVLTPWQEWQQLLGL